uniref:NADH dehydrogenase subunit 6 n=1 Tax=Cocculina enigmadonta TaxID=2729702 RepID=UPI0021FDED1D|nr:NADH dehydrogenase subunit 6 [Cocculina enigmadonta]UXN84355.1 NADH dehydrogenase subunit 6 [Cocculina enigmadonta]
MVLYSLVSLSFCFFIMLPIMLHPLSVGVCVLVISVFSCLLISMVSHAWYGYMLFLIFVGGLLVMFAYVCALTPNVIFTGYSDVFLCLFLYVGIFFLIKKMFFMDAFSVSGLDEISVLSSTMGESLVFPFFMSIIIGLGLILLFTLLAVVKICTMDGGSLRGYK